MEHAIIELLILCSILLGVCIILIVRIFIYRMNIKNMRDELQRTMEAGYNRQLKITLNDKQLTGLAAQINKNLDHQKELKRKAQHSEEELKRSVSDIAHDIRTPLTVIKGNLQLLEKEEMSENARHYLDISAKKADALKKMTDEIFELSVLESDSQPASLKRIDIISLISEFIIDSEALIRSKGLEPVIDFPEKTLYVMGDRDMLLRVFGNLLGNIVKYAEKSFSLKIGEKEPAGDMTETFVSIVLENDVRASEQIDVKRIFDRTYRADKARKSEGAGLGLYIAKLLIEKQGAQITAKINEDRLIFEILMRNG